MDGGLEFYKKFRTLWCYAANQVPAGTNNNHNATNNNHHNANNHNNNHNKMKLFRQVLILCTAAAIQAGCSGEKVPYLAPELLGAILDGPAAPQDTPTSPQDTPVTTKSTPASPRNGLPRYEGAEIILLPQTEDHYVNNVVLTQFQGRFWCMWQASERDEDTPDTHVLVSQSPDGRNWAQPCVLASPTDSSFVSPGFWLQSGGNLIAVINSSRADDRRVACPLTWVSVVQTDSSAHDAALPRFTAVIEQEVRAVSTRLIGAAHFNPGQELCPVIGDGGSWRKARFEKGEGIPIEPSFYTMKNGTLVMLMRDQASSFRKLASFSRDGGESWSAPRLTDIPDSRSKQCAGNLPDGSAFMVWNPSTDKSRLTLAVAFSKDGVRFDRAFVIAGPEDLPPQQFQGRYKTPGYSYPKAIIADGALWVGFSIGKEIPAVARLPLPAE